MCDYCKNKSKNKWLVRSDDRDAGVEAKVVKIDDTAYLSVGGWFDGFVGIAPKMKPIAYCPMCGVKL